MAKTKVVLNLKGFHALRTSPEMRALLSAEATRVQRAAGKNFSTSSSVGKTAVSRVYPNGAAGMREEAKKGVLSKAIAGWGR